MNNKWDVKWSHMSASLKLVSSPKSLTWSRIEPGLWVDGFDVWLTHQCWSLDVVILDLNISGDFSRWTNNHPSEMAPSVCNVNEVAIVTVQPPSHTVVQIESKSMDLQGKVFFLNSFLSFSEGEEFGLIPWWLSVQPRPLLGAMLHTFAVILH